MATWHTARDELLVRENAHTREGDTIAAARRRLPMVELDGMVEVVGPDGPVPFLDLFQSTMPTDGYFFGWTEGHTDLLSTALTKVAEWPSEAETLGSSAISGLPCSQGIVVVTGRDSAVTTYSDEP